MQRFKREFKKRLADHKGVIARGGLFLRDGRADQPSGADRFTAKFDYCAFHVSEGVRCRARAMALLGSGDNVRSFEPRRNLATAGLYLRDMREWGFRLPG